jgi:hypothetical protein
MKNYFAIACITAALCFTSLHSNAQICGPDNIIVPNNYCERGTVTSPYKANLRIEQFDVTTDNSGHLFLKLLIKNLGNQDAWETNLIILLPENTCHASATGMKISSMPVSKPYKQRGGKIELCIGHLLRDSTFSATIKTDMASGYNKNKQKETIAAFVYSSIPDDCPNDNYKTWVNVGVDPACRTNR